MKNVEQAVNEFIGCVKDSETYQKYVQERKRLEMFPDLKQRIDEYRKNLYLLQNTEDGDTLFDEVEQLEAGGRVSGTTGLSVISLRRSLLFAG